MPDHNLIDSLSDLEKLRPRKRAGQACVECQIHHRKCVREDGSSRCKRCIQSRIDCVFNDPADAARSPAIRDDGLDHQRSQRPPHPARDAVGTSSAPGDQRFHPQYNSAVPPVAYNVNMQGQPNHPPQDVNAMYGYQPTRYNASQGGNWPWPHGSDGVGAASIIPPVPHFEGSDNAYPQAQSYNPNYNFQQEMPSYYYGAEGARQGAFSQAKNYKPSLPP